MSQPTKTKAEHEFICGCICGCNTPAYLVDSAMCERCFETSKEGGKIHAEPAWWE